MVIAVAGQKLNTAVGTVDRDASATDVEVLAGFDLVEIPNAGSSLCVSCTGAESVEDLCVECYVTALSR